MVSLDDVRWSKDLPTHAKDPELADRRRRQIADLVGLSIYVMTSEFGAASQLEKIDMLDFADLVVINKFEKRGADDAIRDVRKQVQRNQKLRDMNPEEMPVFGTIASKCCRQIMTPNDFQPLMIRSPLFAAPCRLTSLRKIRDKTPAFFRLNLHSG